MWYDSKCVLRYYGVGYYIWIEVEETFALESLYNLCAFFFFTTAWYACVHISLGEVLPLTEETKHLDMEACV